MSGKILKLLEELNNYKNLGMKYFTETALIKKLEQVHSDRLVEFVKNCFSSSVF